MVFLPYIQEAITALGYLNPECATDLALLLEKNPGTHPRALSAKFRKIGTQISSTEKKALGVRSNAFYSREALATLTPKGRKRPLEAHEVTMLRAFFGFCREREIASALANKMDGIRASGAFADCSGCRSVRGKVYSFEDAKRLPPPECNHEACSLMLSGYFDFLKAIR